MLAVLFDAILSLFPLLCILHPGGNGTDFDLLQRRAKVRVEREGIGRIYVPARWVFPQDLELRTRQGLQVALQLSILDTGRLFDVLR